MTISSGTTDISTSDVCDEQKNSSPFSRTVETERGRTAQSLLASSRAWSFACSRALGLTDGLNGTFETCA